MVSQVSLTVENFGQNRELATVRVVGGVEAHGQLMLSANKHCPKTK